jgi:hypothetical protein
MSRTFGFTRVNQLNPNHRQRPVQGESPKDCDDRLDASMQPVEVRFPNCVQCRSCARQMARPKLRCKADERKAVVETLSLDAASNMLPGRGFPGALWKIYDTHAAISSDSGSYTAGRKYSQVPALLPYAADGSSHLDLKNPITEMWVNAKVAVSGNWPERFSTKLPGIMTTVFSKSMNSSSFARPLISVGGSKTSPLCGDRISCS